MLSWNGSAEKDIKLELKNAYKKREDFLSSSSWNGKTSVGAGVTCSQSLAKKIIWLSILGAYIRGKKKLLLLLKEAIKTFN